MKNETSVTWFEIYVDDMERAREFYETLFDSTLEEMKMPEWSDEGMRMLAFPMTMNTTNGAAGALVKMEGIKGGGNSTIVYFGSEDGSVEEARVEAAGGKIFQTKMSIGEYGFSTLVVDTEGNMIGIHSMS